MRRRTFLTLFGGTAATWPVSARAQDSAMPVVGFLSAVPAAADNQPAIAAFRQGLAETGYREGRNVAVEYIYEAARDQLDAMALNLARRPISVIFTQGTAPALAAQAATKTIPIVFFTGDDPVARGLVATLNRPGGNVTGVTFVSASLSSKRLQLLRSLVSSVELIGVIADAAAPESQRQASEAQTAAKTLGQRLFVHSVANDSEIEMAFADLVKRKAGALLIAGGPFLAGRGTLLSALSERHALPAMYPYRNFAPGGLISYGASFTDSIRQCGVYAGRILRGEKPSELPVVQPTKFDLVINTRTAKALSIEISPMLLALADETIE